MVKTHKTVEVETVADFNIRGAPVVYMMPSGNRVLTKTSKPRSNSPAGKRYDVALSEFDRSQPVLGLFKSIYGDKTVFPVPWNADVEEILSSTYVVEGYPTLFSFAKALLADYRLVSVKYRELRDVVNALNTLRQGQASISGSITSLGYEVKDIKAMSGSILEALGRLSSGMDRLLRAIERFGRIESMLKHVEKLLEEGRVEDARRVVSYARDSAKEGRREVEEAVEEVELPSFAIDNPWLRVLGKFGAQPT